MHEDQDWAACGATTLVLLLSKRNDSSANMDKD